MMLDESENYLRSSYREMLLEHLFAGAVMRHLWLRGFGRLEMLKSLVDDSGYDLVLEANDIVRHIQLKGSHTSAKAAGASVNTALAKKPSGCVIWLRFDPDTLDFTQFLWFGGEPGDKLPDLSSFKLAKKLMFKAQGIKAEKPNIRSIPKAKFEKLETIDEVVKCLFGVMPPRTIQE
ncbi:MAG: hypothetical protein M3R06_00215 [Chloroflexota bacterium]|nr:hypothetical protein [Chloroflexota bacterium]